MIDAHDMTSAIAHIRTKGRKGLDSICVDKAGYNAIRRAIVDTSRPKERLGECALEIWRELQYSRTDGEEIRVCGIPVKIVE